MNTILNWFKRFKFFFTGFFWKQYCERQKGRMRRWGRKHVSLAVVGTPSSGKSFLLKDIIISLRSMGDNPSPLERDGFQYKNVLQFWPDELGGHGGTPFYACRQGNLYGAEMESVGNNKVVYDFDFLNIPGEAFVKAIPEDRITCVDAYNQIREILQTSRKWFTVTAFVKKATGDIKMIVEPRRMQPLTSHFSSLTPRPIEDNARKDRFLKWEEIAKELEDYDIVEGSTKIISGKKLMERFFEYDTDSVMRSIGELIGTEIEGLSFDKTDFESKRYDKAFVFLHYCSKATDIVLCDRIFLPVEDNNAKEIPFEELSEDIAQFIERNNQTTQAYLAFRNVDFMLYKKENAYMYLHDNVLNEMEIEAMRNAIYSIFHSSMLCHLNDNLEIDDEYEYFIGLDQYSNIKKEALLSDGDGTDDFLTKVANKYVDFNGGDGIIVKDTHDLADHIDSRLGAQGNSIAFRGILSQTGVNAINEEIVPHVYFTCTPITADYEMYRNYQIKEEDGSLTTASDFRRDEGKNNFSYFRKRSSHACFGSYQLCMDIMKHHQLRQFAQGSLLRCLQGLENS